MTNVVATAVWDQLVSTALIGTERKPAPDAIDDVAALVGADLTGDSPERRVLTAAGVLATCRRTGVRLPPGGGAQAAAPEPAALDDRPAAPTAATQILELVLAGDVSLIGGPIPLVGMWLEQCAATGHKLPGRLLPAVLDVGSRTRAVREAAVSAGGPALVWLAAWNERWRWAAGSGAGLPAEVDAGDTWRTGATADRIAVLRRLRESDPGQGLALVQETWPGEKAADRAAIVAELAIGLGDHDEAFLDAALDDRAKAVRAAAADLLAQLPASRLAGRMAERLRRLVNSSGRRRRKLVVDLPDEPDAAARRDGVSDQGAPAQIGLRTWWLHQLIVATPLSFWTSQTGWSIDDVVGAGEQTEVLEGWTAAATRQRDSAWAAALLATSHAFYDAGLLTVLPVEQAQAVAEDRVRHCPDEHFAGLLTAVPGPWSRRLTEIVVARIRAAKNPLLVSLALPCVATSADASVADDMENWLAALAGNEHERRQVRHVVHALSLRRSILEAFS